ncbi:MAG TPA: caspase family protein [Candidatus Syntrophosphaera sp.]|nr:caspase family protein [Candidatus Syntrophosphaera sp.]
MNNKRRDLSRSIKVAAVLFILFVITSGWAKTSVAVLPVEATNNGGEYVAKILEARDLAQVFDQSEQFTLISLKTSEKLFKSLHFGDIGSISKANLRKISEELGAQIVVRIWVRHNAQAFFDISMKVYSPVEDSEIDHSFTVSKEKNQRWAQLRSEMLTHLLPEKQVEQVAVIPPISDPSNTLENPQITRPATFEFKQSKDQNKDAIAVIIANRDYLSDNIPAVEFALNDGNEVKSMLVRSFGLDAQNIIHGSNCTKATMESIFGTASDPRGKLYNWIKPHQSDVYIYYTGHGAPDIKNNKAYLLPVDSDPSLIQLTGYSLETLFNNLAGLPYRSLTVVIDACFSGLSPKGMLLSNVSPAGLEVNTPLPAMRAGNVFLSSSGREYSSWHESEGHSLFTYFFLKGMQWEADVNKDRKITAGEMKEYLDTEVAYHARRLNNVEQNPSFFGSGDTNMVRYK